MKSLLVCCFSVLSVIRSQNQENVINRIGRLYLPDDIGVDGSESIAIDYANQRIFSANGDTKTVDVSTFKLNPDISHARLTFVQSLDVKSEVSKKGGVAGDITSVSYNPQGFILATIAAEENAVHSGWLSIINAKTLKITQTFMLPECYLPDHVTQTSTGEMIIISCEGEPEDNDLNVEQPNPAGSVQMIEFRKGWANIKGQTNVGFTAFDEDCDASIQKCKHLPTKGGIIYQSHLDQKFSVNVEPEYAVVDKNDRFAYITLQENNAIAVLNIHTKEIDSIHSLGEHSFSETGLDASNENNGIINISTYDNLYGLRMPDCLDYVNIRGREYILTANEGDSKTFDESRVKDIVLDSTAFPNAAYLQEKAHLGRLKIINQLGKNGKGEYEKLYAFSSRDFTIFEIKKHGRRHGHKGKNGKKKTKFDLKLRYSSMDDFEQKTAELIPDNFNSNDDESDSKQSRSDDKGPEPEAIVVGKCLSGSKKIYAFIALERVGGIMVYDITSLKRNDVSGIHFKQYLNTRNFSVKVPPNENTDRPTEEADDFAPEQLRFYDESYNGNQGKATLFATYTQSSSISVYSVDCM